MATTLLKEKLVVEDMELSMDTEVTQGRGILTPFNAFFLPYSSTLTTGAALDDRYTKAEIVAGFAAIGGSDSEQFKVQDGSLNEHAVNRGQMLASDDLLDVAKAEKSEVIRKGAGETYAPSAGTDPVNKTYADGLIADKFLGAITAQFIAKDIVDGTTDVTVTVTNGVITGIA